MAEASGSALHRVRRLRWQARAPGTAEAFALRSLLREGSEAVHTALEQACAAAMREAATDTGEVWHVPRLVLRIDAADLGRLQAELPGRVALALRDALVAAGVGRPAAIRTASTASADSTSVQALGCANAAHERANLQHYLATGGLTWALAGLATDAIQRVLQQAAVHALHALWAGELRLDGLLPPPADAVEARIGALLRWLPLLPAGLWQRWLASSQPPTGLPEALLDAWRACIAAAPASAASAASAVMSSAASLEWQALWLLWGALPGPDVGPAAAAGLRAWLVQRARATGTSAGTASADDLPMALLRALGHPPLAPPLAGPDKPASPPDRATLTAAATDAGTAQLVALAGLVLLHPFLPRFLSGCGVLDEAGQAIVDGQLPRACTLLHALANGDERPFEHQLPLVKLLLGQPPDMPLAAALPRLDAADRAEVDALLAAVREHWTGLRGTGVEGLRVSFLQRRGLLRRAEAAWQLTVQAEAFDLLMGLLPWSISLVKLAWMPQPLMVEWSTSPS